MVNFLKPRHSHSDLAHTALMAIWLMLNFLPGLSALLELGILRWFFYAVFGLLLLLYMTFKIFLDKTSIGIPGVWLAVFCFSIPLLLNIMDIITLDSFSSLFINLRTLLLLSCLLLMVQGRFNIRMWIVAFVLVLALEQIINIYLWRQLQYLDINQSVNLDINFLRSGGITYGPWQLSYASFVLTAISAICLSRAKSKLIKSILLLIMVLGLWGLFITISRANVAALVLLLIGVMIDRLKCLKRKENPSKRGPLRISLVIFCLVLFFFLAPLLGRFLSESNVLSSYIHAWEFRLSLVGDFFRPSDDRWETLGVAFRMFLDSPICGVGWDRVIPLSVGYGATMISTGHNLFIQALAEGGLFGIVYVGIIFLWIPIRLGWRIRQLPGAWTFLAAWGGVLSYNMIASNLHMDSHWQLLFFWILLLASTGLLPEHLPPSKKCAASGPMVRQLRGNRPMSPTVP